MNLSLKKIKIDARLLKSPKAIVLFTRIYSTNYTTIILTTLSKLFFNIIIDVGHRRKLD